MDKKKANALILVIVILAIALIVSFSKINALEHEIDNVRSHYASEVSMLRQEISGIYQNVDQQLKEEASLLSSAEAEFGELNVDNHTIPVILTVVPKRITEDTALQVSLNGRTADLTKSGNAYIGTILMDLFTEDEQLLLTITTASGTQTQYIQDVYVAGRWYEYLPTLYHCDISGNATFTEGKYMLNAALDINSSPLSETPGVRFEKFVLVTEHNGKEINREDITSDVLNYPSYPDGVYFRDEYKREYAVTEGDELVIRVEATDTLGYVHSMILHYWKEQHGAVAEAINGSELIYDSNGNLLYGKQ